MPAQVKPLIDKTVGEQINIVSERIRNDPSLRDNAKLQWAKACRSIPLQGSGSSAALPPLWLEMKPIRAIAAQPRVDAQNVTLTARSRARDAHHLDVDQTGLSRSPTRSRSCRRPAPA